MWISAWKSVAVGRGEQVACLLLSTVPPAERMLLYQAATAAWLMLPERGQLKKMPYFRLWTAWLSQTHQVRPGIDGLCSSRVGCPTFATAHPDFLLRSIRQDRVCGFH